MISKWEPTDFKLETSSIWSFPERGDWATHDSKYRGNWSPYVPRNILLRYSKEKDWVLDQFAGGGTTLVEAKLLNRNIIGIDVNDSALARCREKCNFDRENTGKVVTRKGDACKLDFIPDSKIDLICTHPPYADIIKYSEKLDNDISLCNVEEFLSQMNLVAKESYRVLKKGRFCAFLIGDIRKQGNVIPLGIMLLTVFESVGFKLKEIIIKQQHNTRSTDSWTETSRKRNFLLLAHEYLFILYKI
jgi:DNA modification methylase